MITKRSIKLGPWPGGLNRRDTGNELRDDELALATNIVFRNDGTIQLRPPQVNWKSISAMPALNANQQLIARKVLRGLYTFFVYDTVANTTTPYQYASTSSWNNVGLTAWSGGALTGSFSDICYYNGFYYIINVPNGVVNGKKSVNNGSAWTDVATLPKGTKCFIHKDRMWVWDSVINRLYWSKATDPTIWAAPDGGFVDIGPNDGDNITAVVVQNNNFYIFKMNSTWQFGYSSDPGVDGFLQVVSPDSGGYEAVTARNAIYVAKNDGIYEFVNNRFILISAKLGIGSALFQYGTLTQPNQTHNPLMASSSKYLYVIGLEDSTGFSQDIYVYDLNTGAWSEWQCQSVGSGASRASSTDKPHSIIADNNNVFCSTLDNTSLTSIDLTTSVINRLDKCGAPGGSQFAFIPYNIQTKNYDFGVTPFWKKHYRHYFKYTYVNTSSTLNEQWFINLTGEQSGLVQFTPFFTLGHTLSAPVGETQRILVKVAKFFTISWIMQSSQNTLQASNLKNQLIIEHIDVIVGTDSGKQALQVASV